MLYLNLYAFAVQLHSLMKRVQELVDLRMKGISFLIWCLLWQSDTIIGLNDIIGVPAQRHSHVYMEIIYTRGKELKEAIQLYIHSHEYMEIIYKRGKELKGDPAV